MHNTHYSQSEKKILKRKNAAFYVFERKKNEEKKAQLCG